MYVVSEQVDQGGVVRQGGGDLVGARGAGLPTEDGGEPRLQPGAAADQVAEDAFVLDRPFRGDARVVEGVEPVADQGQFGSEGAGLGVGGGGPGGGGRGGLPLPG